MRRLLIVTAASDERMFAFVEGELRRRLGMAVALRSVADGGAADAVRREDGGPAPEAVLLHGVDVSSAAAVQSAARAAAASGAVLLACPDAGWLRADPPPVAECRAALRAWRDAAEGAGAAREAPTSDLPIDVPGLVWLGLSLRHEAVSAARDEFGRDPPEASLFGPPDLARVPWVDLAVEALLVALGDRAAPPRPPIRRCVTFDVDAVAKFPSARSLARRLRDEGPRALAEWLAIRAGRRPDPYAAACRFVAERVAALDLPTTWFWLADRGHPLDPPPYLRTAAFGDLRCALPALRTEHALHPSFRTIEEEQRLAAEKAALERAVGCEITSARMHYLRWDHATMPRRLAEAGIRHDSTLGFSRQAGFRAGTRLPFALVDHATLAPIAEVVEVPLVAMDSAYLHHGSATAREYLDAAIALAGDDGARSDDGRSAERAAAVLLHPHNYAGRLEAAAEALERLAAGGGCATIAEAAAAFPA